MKRIICLFAYIAIIALFVTSCTGTPNVRDTTNETTDNVSVNNIADTTTKIELSFELIAGVQGEYGQPIVYNANTEFEENIYGYYVPSGEYTITNKGEYMTQINVLKNEKNIVDGWEECIIVEVFLIDVGQSKSFTVPDNCHIEIAEPTHVLMEKLK